MLSRPSRFSELAALVGCLLLLGAADARAQSCCAGGGAYQPARLKIYEDALVGLQVRAVGQLGSFDDHANYARTPAGVSEVDLEQDLLGTYRVWRMLQVGLVVPIVETRRVVPGLSELGGGLGDITLNARYDFTLPGDSRWLPGVALLGGVTFPTGRAPESATTPLATGATGTGAWQASLGASFEQLFGHVVVNATALLSQSFPRTVNGLNERLGLRVSGLLAAGYVFDNGSALAFTANYAGSMDATLDGETVAGSGQRQLTAGIAGGLPLSDLWRLQGSLNSDLPVLGRNHLAGLGGSATLIRAWF